MEADAASGTCQVRFARRGTYVVAYVDDKLVISYREARAPKQQSEHQDAAE